MKVGGRKRLKKANSFPDDDEDGGVFSYQGEGSRWRGGGGLDEEDEEDQYAGMSMPVARTITQRTNSTTVIGQQPLNNRHVATNVSDLPCFSPPAVRTITSSMTRTTSTGSSSSSSSSSSSPSTAIFRHNLTVGHSIVCAKSKKRYVITWVAENPTIYSTQTPIETLWIHLSYKDYFQCIEDGRVGDDLYIFQMVPTTGEIVVHPVNENNGKLIERKSDKQTQQNRCQMALKEKNFHPTEPFKMIYPTSVYRDISQKQFKGDAKKARMALLTGRVPEVTALETSAQRLTHLFDGCLESLLQKNKASTVLECMNSAVFTYVGDVLNTIPTDQSADDTWTQLKAALEEPDRFNLFPFSDVLQMMFYFYVGTQAKDSLLVKLHKDMKGTEEEEKQRTAALKRKRNPQL